MTSPRALPRRLGAAVLALALTLAPVAALAVQPNEVLADPAQEARAREISENLRCLVCQNQSIDDSNADLARELRLLVREQVAAGKTNAQVTDYLVSRYGDFILLKPPVNARTAILWIAPFATLAFAAAMVWARARRRLVSAAASAPLSEEERRRLDAALKCDPAAERPKT
ncbi:MAG: cytochrome c-type biogenesis protein CcmH [Rhodoblastus sp.]|nr:MAG: cytochrome c-type biogenesis protein CcmH [Rhodoblastus sp.]